MLGEIRVGIFAKQDILDGTELAYDYNFEWYGGAKVRCLCGAPSCSGFLGAKSRGFQVIYLLKDEKMCPFDLCYRSCCIGPHYLFPYYKLSGYCIALS